MRIECFVLFSTIWTYSHSTTAIQHRCACNDIIKYIDFFALSFHAFSFFLVFPIGIIINGHTYIYVIVFFKKKLFHFISCFGCCYFLAIIRVFFLEYHCFCFLISCFPTLVHFFLFFIAASVATSHKSFEWEFYFLDFTSLSLVATAFLFELPSFKPFSQVFNRNVVSIDKKRLHRYLFCRSVFVSMSFDNCGEWPTFFWFVNLTQFK